MTPLLGGLLLNCRVDLCLKRGGPLCGDPGPVARVAILLPALCSDLDMFTFMNAGSVCRLMDESDRYRVDRESACKDVNGLD